MSEMRKMKINPIYAGPSRNRVEWVGTRQRNDLKTCPFCATKALQQVRLADSKTDTQYRIICGNAFCMVGPRTPPSAALKDAEWAWEDRPNDP
jgi:hypothetical protein